MFSCLLTSISFCSLSWFKPNVLRLRRSSSSSSTQAASSVTVASRQWKRRRPSWVLSRRTKKLQHEIPLYFNSSHVNKMTKIIYTSVIMASRVINHRSHQPPLPQLPPPGFHHDHLDRFLTGYRRLGPCLPYQEAC